jgi:hypothetical protein
MLLHPFIYKETIGVKTGIWQAIGDGPDDGLLLGMREQQIPTTRY